MRATSLILMLTAFGSAFAQSEAVICPELEGQFKPGGLLWGEVKPGTSVRFQNINVPVLPGGSFVVGLGRNAPSEMDLTVGEDVVCSLNIATREYRISRVEGVPQRTVTPPPEQLERIRREREKVRSAKLRRIENEGFLKAVKAGLSWPATGRISGVYGSQRFYNGNPGSPHYGVDIARPTGTPVYSPGPGLVTLAEPDLFYSGGTVILDHGYGLSSSFLHMSRIDVEVGDVLEVGDPIGAIGATGRATGPHLDWRMSWFNQRIDPQLLVPPDALMSISAYTRVLSEEMHVLDKKLLQILVCPVTKAPLDYDEAKQELVCKASGLAYPVRDGIPVLLEGEARQLTADEKLG